VKVGLLAEGCYPYMVGGVSGWVQMLIEGCPWYDFAIQTLLPDRELSGKFKYKLPKNVILLREVYLNNDDEVKFFHRRTKMNREEKNNFRNLIFGKNIDWLQIFQFFEKDDISVNDILMGEDFFEIVEDLYVEKYSQCVFTDFLWTIRSLYLPLFTILKVPLVEADCYHAVSTGYAGILACKGHYLHQKPLILTEHGIYTREREEEIIRVDWSQGIFKDLWIDYFYVLSKCVYDCASEVISLYYGARKIQLELGCPEEKTRVIANGVYQKQFENLPGKEQDDQYIRIAAVVRVVPIKDIKTMISAFDLARKKVPNLFLYIMGPTEENPEYYEECAEYIRNFQIENVEFTGRIDVKQYLGKMDMTILTSISEGQPLAILESMASGVPCIATDVGACRELLYGMEQDDLGKCGLIVPVMNVDKIAHAIIKLAENQQLRSEMGQIGRHRVKKFYQNEQVLENYRQIYGKYTGGNAIDG
jgi:glycosyltransferase involved in cell wall biosynthesis